MTRFALAASAALVLIAGCNQDQPKTDSTQTTAAPSHTSAAPENAPKASKLYFEVPKNGKTYVTDQAATAAAISRGEIPASGLVTKENFGPNGETVVFTSDDAGLVAEYTKGHPKAK